MTSFNKVALTAEEQLNLLISRGLVVEDYKSAVNVLKQIGYYHLSAYMRNFQRGINHEFIANTNFKDVIDLYNFDEELRLISFNAIRKIEIAYRAAISNVMCKKYNSHWFYDVNAFKNNTYIKKCENLILSEIVNKKGVYAATFIAKYYQKYNNPALPPFWMSVETFTLGAIATLYQMISSKNQREITQYLGFTTDNKIVSQSNWLYAITVVRNTSAHNARLYNKVFRITPTINRHIKELQINSNITTNSYYYIAMIINYYLKTISNDISFENDIQKLFAKYPQIDKTKMGFPANWNGFTITNISKQKVSSN